MRGPCLAAARDNTDSAVISDTQTDERWPVWGKRVAADLGVRSVLSVQLGTPSARVGALNLYAGSPGRFDVDDQAVAHVLARHAAVAVHGSLHVANLWQAIDARKLIGQAQGILMERFDLDSDQAFAVLRRYSQDTNTKLRDVAQQLIDTRRLPDSSRATSAAEAADAAKGADSSDAVVDPAGGAGSIDTAGPDRANAAGQAPSPVVSPPGSPQS